MMLSLIALACATLALVQAKPLSDSFELYKRQFNKQYRDATEHAQRFAAFQENLREIEQLNKLNGAQFGWTMFSDLTKDEFRAQMLMKKQPLPTQEYVAKQMREQPVSAKKKRFTLPQHVDWRLKNVVTPVKNQAQCGSCWAFSATENTESVALIAGISNVQSLRLSPQQLVDCSDFNFGCGGGELPGAFTSIEDEGGLEPISEYPYRADTGFCRLKNGQASNKAVKISKWEWKSGFFNEAEVQQSLVQDSPLAVCVSADVWQNYKSGVMTAQQCGEYDSLDHCVQLVGFNRTASTPYYMVRNSWTEKWGIDGYIHLEMNQDTCHIAASAVTAVI